MGAKAESEHQWRRGWLRDTAHQRLHGTSQCEHPQVLPLRARMTRTRSLILSCTFHPYSHLAQVWVLHFHTHPHSHPCVRVLLALTFSFYFPLFLPSPVPLTFSSSSPTRSSWQTCTTPLRRVWSLLTFSPSPHPSHPHYVQHLTNLISILTSNSQLTEKLTT